MRILKRFSFLPIATLLLTLVLAGCSSSGDATSYNQARKAQLEQVKAGEFDNGRMWTFDYPPLDYFEKTYDFRPSQEWLDDVRMSSLRFATWCSASFVSADGLVMTNHHCARSSLVKVQEDGENLLTNGFFAETTSDERKVPDLFVEQLNEIRDVTKLIQSARDAEEVDIDRIKAKNAMIEKLEKENTNEEEGVRAQIITLYNGGRYSLYFFQKYEDVRLVFAPEIAVAHYGGEFDNFTYPRYSLDFSFFRVYDQHGQPLQPDHFFNWSTAGAVEDELVFVIGNPGRTSRLRTMAQLEYFRDVQYPYISTLLDNRMEVLVTYVEMHPEKAEDMRNDILGMANSQKAYAGMLSGLRDDVLMQRRRDVEHDLRSKVTRNSDLNSKYGDLWDDIQEGRNELREIAPDMYALRAGGLGVSEYFTHAGRLATLATELEKSEEDRSEAFKGEKLEVTLQKMKNFKDVDRDMDLLTLKRQLKLMGRLLGPGDPVMQMLLQGKSCGDAAPALIDGTVMKDSASYAALIDGAPASVLQSKDPFIRMALAASPRMKEAREVSSAVAPSDEVNRVLLGRAFLDVYGLGVPPDATFSLRIADGIVKGYEYNGTIAPVKTTFYGMYDRAASFKGEEAWELPERWQNPPAEFDLSTPVDFCSTNDIIGGNSGSPMINKKKEVVGLIFDGNIESLPGNFIFAEDDGNRTVSVHSSGILGALKYSYKAGRVSRELERGKLPR